MNIAHEHDQTLTQQHITVLFLFKHGTSSPAVASDSATSSSSATKARAATKPTPNSLTVTALEAPGKYFRP